MSNFFSILGIFSTTLISLWAILKYIILGNYKLDSDASKNIIDKLNAGEIKQWVLMKDFVQNPQYPSHYEAVLFYQNTILFFSRGERLLTAGWQGKEEVSSISFPRWSRKKVEDLLKSNAKIGTISVKILLPGNSDKLGDLIKEENPKIYLEEELYKDIEDDVQKVLNKDKNKTGCLLYGPPGNGKTQFIKYIAKKYSLPIYIIYLNPEYNNHDLALMFSSIPNKCIVLMEDFDNYFDKRECIIKNENIRFTFDSFINALDGIHNDYKQVIFAMTANDISKVDDSIKNRPSRFKFIKEFGNPSANIRMKILNNKKYVEDTEGMSLDQVFAYRDLHE